MKKAIRWFAIIALIVVICISGYKVFETSYQYAQESQVKGSLKKYWSEVEEVGGGEEANRRIKALQNEVNGDIKGWLTVPNTKIDYPFVISIDNDYYLRRDVYAKYSMAGSLFVDYRCDEDFTDFYTIIYGHNMKNNSMFGDLDLFANKDFFENNSSGKIFLKDFIYTFEVFAYMIVDADDEVVYNTLPAKDKLLDYIRKKAYNYREPSSSGKIVALSTCSYDYNGARIVLMGACRPLL